MSTELSDDFLEGMAFMTKVLLAAEKLWDSDDYERGLTLVSNGMGVQGETPAGRRLREKRAAAARTLLADIRKMKG